MTDTEDPTSVVCRKASTICSIYHHPIIMPIQQIREQPHAAFSMHRLSLLLRLFKNNDRSRLFSIIRLAHDVQLIRLATLSRRVRNQTEHSLLRGLEPVQCLGRNIPGRLSYRVAPSDAALLDLYVRLVTLLTETRLVRHRVRCAVLKCNGNG